MREIIKREMHILVQDRKMVLFVVLCAASAYAALIGNLYYGHIVQRIPVVACDYDGSKMSLELLAAVANADQYEIVGMADDDAAIQCLQQKKAAVALVIPQNFSRDLTANRPTELAFITDGSNTLQQGYAANPLQAVLGDFLAKQQERTLRENGMIHVPANPVQLTMRMPENPTQSYAYFYLYGVMLTAAQIGLLVSFGISVHSDFRKKVFFQNGIVKTLLAKQLVYIGLSGASVAMGLSIVIGILHMPYKGELPPLVLLCGAFLFAVANMGGLLALYFRTEVGMIQCMVFYTLPAFLLSGYIWPEIGMVPLIKWLSWALPVHYVLVDFRKLALSGGAAEAYSHSLILLGIGSVEMALIVCRMKYVQRLRQKIWTKNK